MQGHILLVEDESNMAKMQAKILHRKGYTVEAVCNGQEALRLLDQTNFDVVITDLKMPVMDGACQHGNAAAALMALQLLGPSLTVDRAALREGIANAWLPGRQQILTGPVERLIDVAHNGQAARALATTLATRPSARRTHAVFAMLADKDPMAVAGALDGLVDEWHTATLPGPRGQTGERLADGLRQQFPGHPVSVHGDVAEAWTAAMSAARSGDRVVAFGSFLTARDVLGAENG